ncbi:ABC transporter permease [Pseudomonas sp. GX19020]|uniref:ABC transporter permease n=1 Tax=Pseudomonadota TaxID=1224 RepID=UPI00089B3874|nr:MULTISPECIES: ABC transporter permease [Pseudomonadota]MCL4066042.1 ABC transporter permease [Pseudomonas sp. GX19020]SEC70962.1 monosaccharide ABC transporter membrane protein, CUT2 family [Rhodobacter sp. 24-YEA-8]
MTTAPHPEGRTFLSPLTGLFAKVETSLWFPIGVVLALFVFFSFATDSFATLRNFSAVSGQAATLLIVCLGATFIVLMGSIDLSVGAIVLLVGAVSVSVLNAFSIGWLVIPFAALVGAGLGLVNGLIYTRGKIPSFIVTLGTLSVFSGIALTLLDGRAIQFNAPGLEDISIGQWIPRLPNIALWAILAWVVLVVIGTRTRFGRYMYLIGGGEQVARTAGVPVERYKLYAFALSGLLAGFGAILAVARLGAAGPSLGSDLLLNSLAAIVVGGTSLAGGVGGVHRTLIGVLIIAILDNGLNLMGVSQFLQMIIKGLVVIAAVLVSRKSGADQVIK